MIPAERRALAGRIARGRARLRFADTLADGHELPARWLVNPGNSVADAFDLAVAGVDAVRVFREINNVKQERGAGRRRWFEAEGLELIVWLERGHPRHVTGFQVCYDVGTEQFALTWREESGFAHSAVDTGDTTPLKNETPILVPDHEIPWAVIGGRFDENSGSLEPWLRKLVHDKLAERAGAGAKQ